MGLVRNLKKILSNMVDKVLAELCYLYILQKAEPTLKKQDNFSPMGFSLNLLTREDQHTTIVTSSAGTSEKTTMMETEQVVMHIRQWAVDKVQDYNDKGIDRIQDSFAIMAEFDEWFEPKYDLEVVSLDEISEDEYNEFSEGVEKS